MLCKPHLLNQWAAPLQEFLCTLDSDMVHTRVSAPPSDRGLINSASPRDLQ